MDIYPYNYSLILTDDIFTGYGGLTGTSLPLQREAAYIIAEQQVSQYIGTFLLPTIITGSVPYNCYQEYVETEYGYVHGIKNMRVLNPDGVELWNVSGSYPYFTIRDDTFGYIKFRDDPTYPYPNGCYDKAHVPARLEYVYEAGLPTGTANQPGVLMALVVAAQINLSEMVFPFSNESAGDVGVTEFSSLDYKEKRKLWKNTVLGSSAKSSFAARMLDGSIKKARKSLVIR